MSTWQKKSPEHWDNADILDWIYFTAGLNDIQLSALRGENFQGLTGIEFCSMTKDDFVKRDREYGESLYNSFHSLHRIQFKIIRDGSYIGSNMADELLLLSEFSLSHGDLIPSTVQMSELQGLSDDMIDNNLEDHSKKVETRSRAKRKKYESEYFSDCIITRGTNDENLNIRKRKHSSKILLSNFMRDLLENSEYNPSCVRWEDKERGIFRIISGKSKLVAELWGKSKNNPKMTFEKMGRSLRWCRDNNGNFSSIPKGVNYPKKLCFRLTS